MPAVRFLYDLPFVAGLSPMKDTLVTYRPPNAAFRETRSLRILSPDHVIEEGFVLKGKVDNSCVECLYISGEGMKQAFDDVPLGEPVELTFPSGETGTFIYSGIFKDMAAIGSPFFLFNGEATRTFNALAFEIKPGYSVSQVSNAVDDALLENGIDMAGMINVNMRLGQLQGHLEPTYLIIRVTGILTMLIGLAGLIIVLNLTMQERTREIGIMKSIGCPAGKISRLFLAEFLLLSGISLVLGLLIAMPLTSAICRILSETVIYHFIAPKNHYAMIGAVALPVLLVQAMVIAMFTRFQIRKNARELLDHHF